MSLFDKLKDTKLKSLKFGSDKPGGGTSLEPVIQKPILDNNLVGQERSFNDVAEENRARIAKILKSTPRGTRFVRNQTGLQISNAHLETSNAPILNTINLGGGFIGAINKGINFINTANSKFNSTTAAQTTRVTPLHIYSPEVTLAQLESSNGTHLDRFGLTPFIEDRYKYINIANANNTTKDNRLTKLKTKLNVGYDANPNVQVNQLKNKVKSILSGVSSITNLASSISNLFGGSPFLNSVNNKVNNVTKVASPFLDPQIDQYIGGPSSRFGIGATNIRRFDFTNKLKDFEDLKILSNSKAGDARIDVDKYLNSRTATKEFLFVNPEAVFDFPDSAKILFASPATSNKTYNALKTKPLNIVGPITYFSDSNVKRDVKPIVKFIIDKTNTNFEYLKSALSKGGVYDRVYNRKDDKIMSVSFNQINPFTGKGLANSTFSAYMSGYSEDYNSNWTDIKYNGRSEFFYTFNSFKKTASFKLQIPIFNQTELTKKHDELKKLQKSSAGAYLNNRLGGVISTVKLGHYLNYAPCIITNLKITIPNEASWDWGINNDDGDEQAYAMLLEADFSITVIGNEIPGWNLGNTPSSPPIKPEPIPVPKIEPIKIVKPPLPKIKTDETLTKFTPTTFGNRVFGGTTPAAATNAIKIYDKTTEAQQKSLADALTKKIKK
jgi:hypothetical protein